MQSFKMTSRHKVQEIPKSTARNEHQLFLLYVFVCCIYPWRTASNSFLAVNQIFICCIYFFTITRTLNGSHCIIRWSTCSRTLDKTHWHVLSLCCSCCRSSYWPLRQKHVSVVPPHFTFLIWIGPCHTPLLSDWIVRYTSSHPSTWMAACVFYCAPNSYFS